MLMTCFVPFQRYGQGDVLYELAMRRMPGGFESVLFVCCFSKTLCSHCLLNDITLHFYILLANISIDSRERSSSRQRVASVASRIPSSACVRALIHFHSTHFPHSLIVIVVVVVIGESDALRRIIAVRTYRWCFVF
jgi:hypothetical protein